MNDQANIAVDDCAATHIFGRAPPATRSEAGGGFRSFEYGRQFGNWNAANTVQGSGIDDGVLTAIQLPQSRGGLSAGDGEVQALSADALKKLKKATQDDGKKNAAARAEEEAKGKEVVAARAQSAKAESVAKAAAKGFYVPKKGLGIKIVGKDGKTHVVVPPQSSAKSAPAAPKEEANKKDEPAQAPTAAPETALKVASEAPSAKSHPAVGTRRVRITGKNGEEAFVELPILQAVTKAVSPVSAPVKAPSAKANEINKDITPPAQKSTKDDNAGRDQKAAKAAQALRAEREKQEKEEKEQRDRQARAVANAMMSGGLGGSRKSSPAAKSASCASPSIINGVLSVASKVPSKVSSRTMTPPPARVGSVRANSHLSSQRAKTVSLGGWQMDGAGSAGGAKASSGGKGQESPKSNKGPSNGTGTDSVQPTSQDPSRRSKPTSQRDWQELGSAIMQPAARATPNPSLRGGGASFLYRTPTPQPAQQPYTPAPPPGPLNRERKKASTPPSRPMSITSSEISRKIAGIHQWNNATPTSIHPPAPPYIREPTPMIDVRRANNASQDTVYAGTGWISPHPLSCAPTEFAMSPQEQISVLGRRMTYEEWRGLQEGRGAISGPEGNDEVRRNFSRTSSNPRTILDGSWGAGAGPASIVGAGGPVFRGGEEPGGWLATGATGASQSSNYRAPTVVSEHSQHSRFSHYARSVRSSSLRSGPLAAQQSFHDSPPGVGQWPSAEQMDGPGSMRSSAPRSRREVGNAESPVGFGRVESVGDTERDGSVRLRMPWDRESVVGVGSHRGGGGW